MASDRGHWYPGTRIRESRAETRVRAAAIVVEPPGAKNPPQVVLLEWNQEVQALPAEAAEEPFTEGVGLGRVDWSAEDPALCANMNETLPPSEFRVEGGEGLGNECAA